MTDDFRRLSLHPKPKWREHYVPRFAYPWKTSRQGNFYTERDGMMVVVVNHSSDQWSYATMSDGGTWKSVRAVYRDVEAAKRGALRALGFNVPEPDGQDENAAVVAYATADQRAQVERRLLL